MFNLTKDSALHGALFAPLWDEPDVFTDSYSKLVDGTVSLADFIANFYATPLFKLERFTFRLFLGMRVTDGDVEALANGADSFAVWDVQARNDAEIVLKDRSGHTLSWLMVKPEGAQTRLIFGSAVLPGKGGKQSLLFKLLLPFHTVYAHALLASAKP